MDNPSLPVPEGTPRFQISQDDLCELERLLPILCDRLMFSGPGGKVPGELQVKIRVVKRILSDVRWNYQPYGEVDCIPVDDDPPDLH